MVAPDERRRVLDLVRPPVGYDLEAAIWTTYSLDFVSLTTVLLALIDEELDEQDPLRSKAEIFRAIARLVPRLRIYFNNGYILPQFNATNRVFSLYGQILSGV